MCYPKPGPRCSHHSKQALTKATTNYQQAKQAHDEAERNSDPALKKAAAANLETAAVKMREATNIYHTTPDGQKRLKETINNTSDERTKHQLTQRLNRAIAKREKQLAAYMIEKNKPTITLTIGAPASGKTTWALKEAERTGAVIVCRDDTREEIGINIHETGVGTEEQEKQVTVINEKKIRDAITAGKSVIIADTNIKPGARDNAARIAKQLGARVEHKRFDVPVTELLRRNANRDRQVPEFVIHKMVENLQQQQQYDENLNQARNVLGDEADMDRIKETITGECLRQHVGVDRMAYLAEAYAEAYKLSRNGLPTLDEVVKLAGIIEPDNRGKLRRTDVTFASGGSATSGQNVPQATERLFELLDDSVDVDEWVHAFEKVHPFTDGNGRTGWLLRVWLKNQWNSPKKLPKYRF